MKKVMSFLKKYNTPLTYGIILLCFGLAFIFVPAGVLDWLVAIAGVFTVFVSGVKLAELLDKYKAAAIPFSIPEIIKSALFLFFGITLIVLRSGFAKAICALLGLYLIAASVLNLIKSQAVPVPKRSASWIIDIVLSVLLIILGLWLVVYPLWPGVLVGIALTVFGAELIGQESTRRKKENKGSLEDGIYYTDDFKDKSDM